MSTFARPWDLDPAIRFLNHGSFGACPRAVLDWQAELRREMEREPVRFLARELEGRLDAARESLAAFVGARADDLAFVSNATTGVNTVVRCLDLRRGDELLTTDHAYNACRNALDAAAEAAGARVVVAPVPFPLGAVDEVVDPVLHAVGPRTRLALLDHVTSPTGLVWPVERLVEALRERGVESLVDGAHGPGMVPLDLTRLGAAWYTGNLHKWVCAPKGAAFLHVRPDLRQGLRPLVVSHGRNATRTDRGRFRREHDWTGTCDPTPWLCVPEAIRFLGSLLPGGWEELRERNRGLALGARDALCRALGIPAPAPDEMVGALAAVPVPASPRPAVDALVDPLQAALFDRHGIEVPVYFWPRAPRRILRVSAAAYNEPGQYDVLAEALPDLLEEGL